MSTLLGEGTAMPFPYSPEKAIAKQIIQRAIAFSQGERFEFSPFPARELCWGVRSSVAFST